MARWAFIYGSSEVGAVNDEQREAIENEINATIDDGFGWLTAQNTAGAVVHSLLVTRGVPIWFRRLEE